MFTQTTIENDTNVYHACRFCGAAVEGGRLICAPEDASMCIDRQDAEAASAFPAFRIVAHGRAYASTYPTVAAAEASLREVACVGQCGCCRVESLNNSREEAA